MYVNAELCWVYLCYLFARSYFLRQQAVHSQKKVPFWRSSSLRKVLVNFTFIQFYPALPFCCLPSLKIAQIAKKPMPKRMRKIVQKMVHLISWRSIIRFFREFKIRRSWRRNGTSSIVCGICFCFCFSAACRWAWPVLWKDGNGSWLTYVCKE